MIKAGDIYIRDPFVFAYDGGYCLVGTTDETAWEGKAQGFKGYFSRNLIDFEGPYKLFDAGGDFWGRENFWAPELFTYRGKFYIFASFKAEGVCRRSQILVSDTPLGRYAPLADPFTPADWECLDATLYIEDGVPYSVFCREWVQVTDGEMWAVRLKDDLSGPAAAPKLLFKASEAEWTRPIDGRGSRITDGPFLYRLESGRLIMLWSSLGEKGYAMGQAVSENGIFGPWRQKKLPLFSKDGGHGMVFKKDGKSFIALHAPNEPHMSERPIFIEAEESADGLELKA